MTKNDSAEDKYMQNLILGIPSHGHNSAEMQFSVSISSKRI